MGGSWLGWCGCLGLPLVEQLAHARTYFVPDLMAQLGGPGVPHRFPHLSVPRVLEEGLVLYGPVRGPLFHVKLPIFFGPLPSG